MFETPDSKSLKRSSSSVERAPKKPRAAVLRTPSTLRTPRTPTVLVRGKENTGPDGSKRSRPSKPRKNKKSGKRSSESGNEYELQCHRVTKKLRIDDQPLNVNSESDLAGSSSKNDMILNYRGRDIPVELKKGNTDYMQSSLHFDLATDQLMCSVNNKIPDTSRELFQSVLDNNKVWDNRLPSFVFGNVTKDESDAERKYFPDTYLECPSDMARNLYKNKGCYYIQVHGKGLYHTGEDPCGFGVPEFECLQHLRIRVKEHKACNAKGYCSMSVMMSCRKKY